MPRRSPGLFSARFPCCACSLLSRPHHTGMHGGLILPPAHASRPCKGCPAPSQLSAQPEPHQLVKSHLLCKAGIQALLFNKQLISESRGEQQSRGKHPNEEDDGNYSLTISTHTSILGTPLTLCTASAAALHSQTPPAHPAPCSTPPLQHRTSTTVKHQQNTLNWQRTDSTSNMHLLINSFDRCSAAESLHGTCVTFKGRGTVRDVGTAETTGCMEIHFLI